MNRHKQKKRKVLSIGEKYKIVKQIEAGLTKSDACKRFGLVNSTVQGIWKNRYKIKHAFEHNGSCLKRLRRSERDDVDQALFTWFNKQPRQPNILNGRFLRAKAEELARTQFNNSEFVCTKSWLDRFKVRHNISFSDRFNSESERSSASAESSVWAAEDDDDDDDISLRENGSAMEGYDSEVEKESFDENPSEDDQEEHLEQINHTVEYDIEDDEEEEEEMNGEHDVSTDIDQHHHNDDDDDDDQSSHEDRNVGADNANYANSTSNSSSDEEDDEVVEIKRPIPTVYDAVNAIDTIARFYNFMPGDENRILSAIKTVEEDLEQRWWIHFQQAMATMKTSTDDEEEEENSSYDESNDVVSEDD